MYGEALFSVNISDVRFVAFDTETTGINPNFCHVVEIAALAFDEEFEHRNFVTFVKPPVPIPKEASGIHGITDEMVATEPSSADALPKFFEFLKWAGTPRILIAHNAGFDVGFIEAELTRSKLAGKASAGAEIAPEIVIDSCMLARLVLPDLPSHSLLNLSAHFGLGSAQSHRALDDVRLLKDVFMKLISIAADKSTEAFTCERLIDWCSGYFILNAAGSSREERVQFKLPPRLDKIQALCGTDTKISITYDKDEDYRYITPIAIKLKGMKVYLEAFCHRDQIKKTFRADRILKVGQEL